LTVGKITGHANIQHSDTAPKHGPLTPAAAVWKMWVFDFGKTSGESIVKNPKL
jgi:hypothetical protein